MANENFSQGNLLKIVDYQFQDGEGSRDKYLIVLHLNEKKAFIIHTLTTSKNHKDFKPKKSGCNHDVHVSYFYFPAGEIIGDENFSFKLNTFVFFRNNIRQENISSFAKYPADKICVEDVLPKSALKQLIDCMLGSSFVTMEEVEYLKTVRASL